MTRDEIRDPNPCHLFYLFSGLEFLKVRSPSVVLCSTQVSVAQRIRQPDGSPFSTWASSLLHCVNHPRQSQLVDAFRSDVSTVTSFLDYPHSLGLTPPETTTSPSPHLPLPTLSPHVSLSTPSPTL